MTAEQRGARTVKRLRIGGALAFLAVVVIVGVVACRESVRGGRAGRRSGAEGNLSNLFHMGIDGGKAVGSRLTGKAFVLSLFVRGTPDLTRRPAWVSLLFAPGDVPDTDRPSALTRRYQALTLESLATEINLGELTTHVGRARAMTDSGPPAGDTPLIADLVSVSGYAIVYFADGSSSTLDRRALGLGPDDPNSAGPTSQSPLLRMLLPN